jgi:hypothetical protein
VATTEELADRISKLEKEGKLKFFVQYLLSPLLIISVGTFINWRIEQGKAEAQRLELAQKMITTMFSGNADQAFATERLLTKVVDPDYAADLHQSVARYYQNKVDASIKQGDVEGAARIVSAARTIGGTAADQVVQSVDQNQTQKNTIQAYTSKSQEAAQKEREGFEKLITGDYDSAAASFEAAEQAYHSYHSAYEIAHLLRLRSADLNDPARRKAVLQEIVSRHAYGAPPDLLQRLRELANS